MKRTLLPLIFSGLLLSNLGYSQTNKDLPTILVDAPNLDLLAIEDEERNKNGAMYRISIGMPVEHDMYKDGEWFTDQSGNLIYNIQFESQGAKALNVIFDELTLPENAEMRLYNPVTGFVVGPYTSEDAQGGSFYTAFVTGDKMVLEVMIPAESQGEFQMHIKEVGYFYRNVDPFEGDVSRDFGDSESCEVNAVCTPESNNFQEEKNGVCRIFVVEGSFGGWCSGSLIGNTANDCTPYVLTAQHCGSAASTSNFRSWVFYFKYESAGCSTGSEPSSFSVTGSVKVAASGTVSDVQKSDFLLVIIRNRPNASANAYYNGWDRNNTAATGGKGIHHPAGDIKKISTFTGTLVSTTWAGPSGTHWRVTWTSTTNGHGVTEGGSSGSPIFNSSGLIVGDLSGGSSFCSSPSSPDLYGKLSYSWNSCGTSDDMQLEPWLDRSGTSATTLAILNSTTCPTTSIVDADFTASSLFPLVSTEVVTLNDLTTNSPFYWKWDITGPGTPTFVNGTDKYSQFPQVTFPAPGYYSVVLTSANTAGYDFKTRANYIKVGNIGIDEETNTKFTLYPNPVSDVLYVSLDNTTTWDVDKATISIMDLTGRFVLIERMVNSNANTLSVNIPENIGAGFYLVQITDGKNSHTEKIEILK